MKNLLVVLALLPGIIFARGTSGAIGTFGPTLALIDFSSLNNSLRNTGFNEVSSQHWMFGGGGYLIANRTTIGGAGWGGTQTVTTDSVVCRIYYGGGEFRAGYILLDSRYLLITPGIGVGGDGYTINLEPENHNVYNFDSLLLNPGRTATVSLSRFSLNPQIAFTIPISFVGIDIRGGFNIGPFDSKWRFADHGVLRDGPKMAIGTPWVSLNIFFGGFTREKGRVKTKFEPEGESKSPEKDGEPVEEK